MSQPPTDSYPSQPGSGAPHGSSVLSRLHPELARPFLTGFAEATSLVFAVGAVVLVVGLVAALLLPDEQLLAGDD